MVILHFFKKNVILFEASPVLSQIKYHSSISLVISARLFQISILQINIKSVVIPSHTIVGGIMVSCWASKCVSVCLSVIQLLSCSYFHFWMITSKYQWIITKLDTHIDIVEIWFGIAYGQILSIFERVICLLHDSGGILWFHNLILFLFLSADLVWSMLKINT